MTDLASLPPATQQQIAQQLGATTPDEIAEVLQELASDPDKLDAVLKQLGVDESGWIEQAASDASGPPSTTDTTDVASDGVVEQAAPSTAIDEGETVDEAVDEAEQTQSLYPQATAAGNRYNQPINDATDDLRPPDIGGNDMAAMKRQSNIPPADDIISADMMEQTTGNPNAKVPQARNMGKMQRPAVPTSKSGGGDNREMITQIYRELASKQGAKAPQQPPQAVRGASAGRRRV